MRENPLLMEGLAIIETKRWGRKALALYMILITAVGVVSLPSQSLGFYLTSRQSPAYLQAMAILALVASSLIFLVALSRILSGSETLARWILYAGTGGASCAYGKLLVSFLLALVLSATSLPLLLFAADMNGMEAMTGLTAGLFILLFLLSYGGIWALLSTVLSEHPGSATVILWCCAAFQLLFSVRVAPVFNPALTLLRIIGSGAAPGPAAFLKEAGTSLLVLAIPLALLFPLSLWQERRQKRKEGERP